MKKEISIRVVKGKIHVTPNSCKAHYHDQIEWKSGLPFVIYFGYFSPLNTKVYSNNTPHGRVKYSANLYGQRTFKYIVGVIKSGQILILDPDLDIQP